TGLRISEFCGLTTHIDMQNRILNIDHQLLKDSEIGYYIETPKTKNGKRELPLTERAYQAIQRILKNRGMNPNTLQYLMGHANITMTLGYYAHGTFQSAKAELERLAC
ncbi:site-specific integrase, partial [Clostridioides difficile]|uniref:site-specific integrase n=1 Tax=Clostridioides difficile TaxID=1496 RepID=UPI0005B33693